MARAARGAMRRPVVSLAIGAGVMLLAAAPLFGMKTGVSGVNTLPDSFQSKQAFAVLASQFSAGLASPTQIVIDGPAASPQVQAAVSRLRATLAGDRAFGAVQAQTDKAGDLTLLSVPIAGSSTSDLALAKVRELRDTYIPQAFAGSPAKVYVTGNTAFNVDYIDIVNSYFPWVIALVLALSFVLSDAGLPFGGRAGHGDRHEPAERGRGLRPDHSCVPARGRSRHLRLPEGRRDRAVGAAVPVLGAVRPVHGLPGLPAVAHQGGVRPDRRQPHAVSHGIGVTAGIITGAALIMVAVFAGFASGKLVMFEQMGFGLGVAILLDATLVRMLLVPSAMSLFGKANWYLPRWLEWLPRLTIESTPMPLPAVGGTDRSCRRLCRSRAGSDRHRLRGRPRDSTGNRARTCGIGAFAR